MSDDESRDEAVRRACLRAAVEAYEDAGMRGLCPEGRWELALDALANVDLRDAGGRAVDDREPLERPPERTP